MTNLDLRTGLADIASDVHSVDLYDRALSRSRQIRRRRHAGAAVAAVVVLAITGLAWQLLPSAGTGPVDPAESATPTPSPPTPTGGPIEPGTEGSFGNATLPVPAWPALRHDIGGACPSELITFRDHTYVGAGAVTVTVGVSVPFPVPGDTHYITSLVCRGTGVGGASQIVAYRVENGRYAVVDVIVDSTLTPAEGEWAQVLGWNIDPASSPDEVGRATFSLWASLIGADLGDRNGRLAQNRTYKWNGAEYVQTAGHTSFLADPAAADLSLTAGEMTFDPRVRGCQTGTIPLTITNHGSAPVSDVGLHLVLHGLPHAPSIANCPGFSGEQSPWGTNVTIGVVEAGQTRTELVTVVLTAAITPEQLDGPRFAFIRIGSSDGRPEWQQQWTGVKVPFSVVY